MKVLHGITAAVLMPGWLWGAIAPAGAEVRETPDLHNSNIIVEYYEPRSPQYQPIYTKLRQRRVLEELAQFLAPVKWPKTLRVIMKECPASGVPTPEVFYLTPEYTLNLCYSWFKFLEGLNPRPSFATRQEVIVGGLVGAVLHAAGRAMFDMLNVPVLGSEEDAADQISSFVGMQFGPAVARTIVKGTYYVWDTYDYKITHGHELYNFADGSSVPPQREYNILCIAYGGMPTVFKELVDKGLLNRVLPAHRAGSCKDEYEQVRQAFNKTIRPHVDPGLMTKVQSMTWIWPEDLK